jgi:hypothetical protein
MTMDMNASTNTPQTRPTTAATTTPVNVIDYTEMSEHIDNEVANVLTNPKVASKITVEGNKTLLQLIQPIVSSVAAKLGPNKRDQLGSKVLGELLGRTPKIAARVNELKKDLRTIRELATKAIEMPLNVILDKQGLKNLAALHLPKTAERVSDTPTPRKLDINPALNHDIDFDSHVAVKWHQGALKLAQKVVPGITPEIVAKVDRERKAGLIG